MKNRIMMLSVFLVGILITSSLASAGWIDWLSNREDKITGQAYVEDSGSQCLDWEKMCEQGNKEACNLLKAECTNMPSGEKIELGKNGPKFKELWVDTIYPFSQKHVSIKADNLVLYSKDNTNKLSFDHSEWKTLIYSNKRLETKSMRDISFEGESLSYYSPDRKNKMGMVFSDDGAVLFASGGDHLNLKSYNDIILDPSRDSVIKADDTIIYSDDNKNKISIMHNGAEGTMIATSRAGGTPDGSGDLTIEASDSLNLILKSPDGSKWKIKVSDSGSLFTEEV